MESYSWLKRCFPQFPDATKSYYTARRGQRFLKLFCSTVEKHINKLSRDKVPADLPLLVSEGRI